MNIPIDGKFIMDLHQVQMVAETLCFPGLPNQYPRTKGGVGYLQIHVH